MTVFALQRYDGAYAAFSAHDEASASWVYVLAGFAKKPDETLSLDQAWAIATSWALIVRESVWDFTGESPSDAAKTLNLAATGQARLVMAWRADPALSAAWWWQPRGPAPQYQTIVAVPGGGGGRQTLGVATVAFGNIALTVPPGAAVTLGEDGASLHLARTGAQFSLGRADVRIGLMTYDSADLLTSGANGVAAGALRTAGVNWAPRGLFLLGQDANQVEVSAIGPPEVRFWWAAAEGPQRLRLPVFTPLDVTAPRIGVSFALNPALPFDPAATRFDISAATQGCLASTAGLMTLDGSGVGLAAVSGVGFHIAPGLVAGQNRVYLAPYGRFALVAPTGTQGPFQLMPGLSGLEYIEAEAGDFLDFIPASPAFGAPSPAAGTAPQLTIACTTAWVRLTPAGPAKRPYFAQPLKSVFYASPDGKALPRAAQAQVSEIGGAEAPYPLAPYANAFAAAVLTPPPAEQITTFEQTYLTAKRGAVLGSGKQPVFSLDGKVLTQKGATPRGLFAEIGPTPTAPSGRLLARKLGDTPTPPGQWRRLYLAKGVSRVVTLEPSAEGVVDPVVGNALLQPDVFFVYNNWTGHPIRVTGELDVGGFVFEWASLDRSMLVVSKLTNKISLRELFATPEQWRDAATLVGDGGDIAQAQQVFQKALDTAEEARKAGSPLFDDFLDRIAGSKTWTGIVVFGAVVDGGAMPPTLQILMAGMSQPLHAHHVAVDVTAISSAGGVPQDPGPSSVAGVIYYEDPGGTPPSAAKDYGFYTQSLKVGIFGSTVTSFNAEVAVTARKLFGRAVELRARPGDPYPDTFLLKGVYHVIANVPTVLFQTPEARVFDFLVDPSVSGGGLYRVLERFEIDAAGIMSQPDTEAGGRTAHHAQISLSGQLWFAADPFSLGVDLFSYGRKDGAGLALDNFSLAMTFDLAGGRPTLAVDYSRLAVADTFGALRPDGMVAGLPFKLKGIIADDAGLDVAKLGGKPVQVLQLASQQTKKPHFALQFELIIGSLGELSGVHAGLTAEMRLAWGPLDSTPDADGALVTIQLPGASGGFKDMNVQGMLQMVFGEANLLRVVYDPQQSGDPIPVYAILFNNVAISLMGIKLPPKVISDLILFSDPTNATNSNLAACLAVRQQ